MIPKSLTVSTRQGQKNYNFMLWAMFILEKRGIKVNLNSCILDRVLQVDIVLPLGSGCFFKTKNCYGCHATKVHTKSPSLCWLQDTFIPSPVKLKKDEFIYMPSLPQMLKGVPVLRYTGDNVGFFSSFQ